MKKVNTIKNFRINFILIAIVILIFGLSTYYSENKILNSPDSLLYDKTFTIMMQNISQVVPHNDTIVISIDFPEISFFTGVRTFSPSKIDSQESLVNYMGNHSYNYLLVFPNQPTVFEKLQPLFNTKQGIQNLTIDFNEVGKFRSDNYQITLYKIKSLNNGT